MKIDEVYIQNFRGYGINYDREDKMYAFKGLSKCKMVIFSGFNGFGKTSFFDAIEWCLTDKIRRLEKIEKTLMLSNLKKSHMLKFINGSSEDRLVQVAIRFENGVYIKRISKNNSLYEQGYSSVVLDENNNQVDVGEIIKANLLSNELDIEDLLRISFCGQDSIADLLRTTKATERTEIFMKLLGLNEINELVSISDGNKFRKITENISTIDTKINQIDDDKKQIEEIFSASKWKTPKEYKSKVRQVILDVIINDKNTNNSYLELIKSEPCESFTEIIELLEKVNIKKEYIDHEVVDNRQILSQIQYFKFLKKWIEDKSYINKIDFINKFSYKNKNERKVHLASRLNEFYEEVKYNQSCIDELSKTSQKLQIINKKYMDLTSINTYIKQDVNDLIIIINSFSKLRKRGYCSRTVDIKGIKKQVNKLLRIGVEYSKNLENLMTMINAKKQSISIGTKINGTYSNLLLEVKKHILSQDIVNECPVCKNKEIIVSPDNEYKTIKDKLLIVINNTISDGNQELQKLQHQIALLNDKYNEIYDLYKQKVIDQISNTITEMSNNGIDFLLGIKTHLLNQTKCQNQAIEYWEKQMKDLNDSISMFKERYKETFGQEYEETKVTVNNEEISDKVALINKLEKSRIAYFNNNGFCKDSFSDELIAFEYKSIAEKTKKYNEPIKYYVKKQRELLNAQEIMGELLTFRMEQSSKDLLRRYEESNQNRKQLITEMESMQKFSSNRVMISERAKALQNELLDILIKENPLILWIYNQINPHPYFRKFEIVKSNNGINIMDPLQKDIYLDHIFSTAQVNVLALSIYLGIALSTNNAQLGQLYMDDPIQSMDDINMLSYIDLVRMICNSSCIDKTMLIATHDHNFSKLLTIKMRNYTFKKFDFKYYGPEGPRIDVISNNV